MKRIVLTGGPCSGKTTAQSYLREKLSNYGYNAVFVPEAATFVINSGLNPQSLDKKQIFAFEELLLKTQLRFEDDIFRAVSNLKGGPKKKRVMISDRGCMDFKAYIDDEMFEKILRKNRLNIVGLRDRRYDAVFHLVTAAEGREEYYNLDNPARTETPHKARILDQKLRNAWLGHPHLVVIDNSTLFNGKMRRLLNAVRKALGIPVAIETERKFLIHNPVDLVKLPVPHQVIDIEQIYLKKSRKGQIRLRKRSQENEGSVYYQTLKLPTRSAMSRVEIERQIGSVEYYRRQKDRDSNCAPIHKKRICFLWQNQYFELDIFTEPKWVRGLTLLEIELTEENDEVKIPAWLGKVTEVTSDPKYKNSNLAHLPN